MLIHLFCRIDPQILLSIYMRHSLSVYRAAHAKLTAQDPPPDHFYRNFRIKCEAVQEIDSRQQIIKEMGMTVDLPPCLMARLVLKSFLQMGDNINVNVNANVIVNANANANAIVNDNDNANDFNINSSSIPPTNNEASKAAKQSTARITEILRNPETIRPIDPLLSDNLIYCIQNDFLTSPLTDQYRLEIGVEREVFMHERLREMGILFHSEADMRAAGYPKTPDALLAYPVEIDGHIVNWIESKALFSDIPTHQTYLREQYWPYFNRFGPGLVIYWYGFIEEITNDRESEKGILVMSSLPDRINKITFN